MSSESRLPWELFATDLTSVAPMNLAVTQHRGFHTEQLLAGDARERFGPGVTIVVNSERGLQG